ncbi:hypothetical protein HGG64_00040 [Mycoplasma phocoeninasale]|uniref:Uncharacterized protein n=1 Tax=Mycoplasma phocoeninasale TaxID=2726117 RepID=A0A858U4C9_9MOLU|nr:hypothetical protein [Mycoplasma phocoeninasale]QJG66125.1 hypothetical protein HGG64_00040 [Mycoplasma phocoeninasale]
MEIAKKRKSLIVFGSILTPIAIAGSIGGAIYFVIRNTRRIRKVYWSPEDFLKKAKADLLPNQLVESFTPKTLYDNFNSQRKIANIAIEEYDKLHPEIKNYIKSNSNKQRNLMSNGINIKKLLKDRPKPFDANKFLSEKLKNNLNFDDVKFLDFRYSDIELTDNPQELKVHYEVFLNYEFAAGNFETSAQKGTPDSKYYYASSKVIKIISKNEKWDLGTIFYQNLELLSNDFKNVINEKPKDPQWFDSEEFQMKIFKIFEDAAIKYDSFPDIYPKEDFDIVSSLEKGSNSYVKWNPVKGLNSLTITYRYINKKNNEIKSEIRKKNFVVLNA